MKHNPFLSLDGRVDARWAKFLKTSICLKFGLYFAVSDRCMHNDHLIGAFDGSRGKPKTYDRKTLNHPINHHCFIFQHTYWYLVLLIHMLSYEMWRPSRLNFNSKAYRLYYEEDDAWNIAAKEKKKWKFWIYPKISRNFLIMIGSTIFIIYFYQNRDRDKIFYRQLRFNRKTYHR